MNILMSNDDGVYAPGIKALNHFVSQKVSTTVIAPTTERSTTGHSLNLDSPLRLEKIKDNVYGCTGFPADCVLMGLGNVCRDRRPDMVFSGINRGANLGQDLYYSGTLAAAREATFHGVPAVGFSLVYSDVRETLDYEGAAQFAAFLVELEVQKYIPELTLLDVNYPNIPRDEIRGVKLTTVGLRNYSEVVEHRVDSRERDYYWVVGDIRPSTQDENTDCQAIADKYISITPP